VGEKKFTLIGKKLTAVEAATFPDVIRFKNSRTSSWFGQKPEDLLQDETFHHLDRFSMLMMTSVKVQCPWGPHDDAGLEVVILRACGTGPTMAVIVQCTQGHWAEYPCG
jgi:hypothetical protein